MQARGLIKSIRGADEIQGQSVEVNPSELQSYTLCNTGEQIFLSLNNRKELANHLLLILEYQIISVSSQIKQQTEQILFIYLMILCK